MKTPLEKVKELNYDHHRRMTQLHLENIKKGVNPGIKKVDDASYINLLFQVPRDRKKILELGSASGGQWDLLREWAPHGTLTGIDLYEPLVAVAQGKGQPIFLGYVEDMMMFEDASFDLVCSRHVMEHLGDVEAGIKEIHRVLMPGGYSAHVTPDMVGDVEPAHLNKWPVDKWVEQWKKLPFKVISARKYSFHGGESHIVCRKEA